MVHQGIINQSPSRMKGDIFILQMMHEFDGEIAVISNEILMNEAVKMYQSKNPETNKLWTLEAIGERLGGYGQTAVYKLLLEAGIDTKRPRI